MADTMPVEVEDLVVARVIGGMVVEMVELADQVVAGTRDEWWWKWWQGSEGWRRIPAILPHAVQ